MSTYEEFMVIINVVMLMIAILVYIDRKNKIAEVDLIMDKEVYCKIESYMLSMMKDSAHDFLHVYRVLYQALNIAQPYNNLNQDILIASCLLHDIGRQIQFENPDLCHAIEGGKLAYNFLKETGWSENDCLHVRDCVTTHRYRTDNPPRTLEAKILFDADKLDVTGALGIARSLLYKGQVGEPLYTVDEKNLINDGRDSDDPESFLKEYHFKLINLYDNFYTKEAEAIAKKEKILQHFFMMNW